MRFRIEASKVGEIIASDAKDGVIEVVVTATGVAHISLSNGTMKEALGCVVEAPGMGNSSSIDLAPKYWDERLKTVVDKKPL